MKTFFIKSLLLTSFLLGFGNLLFADDTGSPIGAAVKKPGGTGDECNSIYLDFAITLANLDLYLPLPDQNGTEYLPEGYPSMYFRYHIIGGPTETIPVTSFLPVIDNNGNVSFYQATISTLVFDFCEDCINSDGSTGVDFTYSSALLTLIDFDNNGNPNYSPYPACTYASPDDIFSCEIFPEQTGECGSGNNSCNNTALTTSEGVLVFDCGGQDDPGLGGGGGSREENTSTEKNTNKISATPNPFTNNINLQLETSTDIQSVEIFDTQGRFIKSWSQDNLSSSSALNLDTSDLTKGLYFLTVKTAETIETIKLIKQ